MRCGARHFLRGGFPAGWKSAKEYDILRKISNPLLRYAMAGGYKEITMEHRFLRTEMVLGDRALDRLSRCHVAVFGLGGVGSYAAEALARAGVGALDLYDDDTVSESNLNRQLIATRSTVGKYKVDVMEARMKDINPNVDIRTHKCFFLPENADEFPFSEYDYIVDAMDTVSAKLSLAVKAQEAGVPIISSMGAGNKLDATAFRVADIYKTSMDPLARVMRRELSKRGIRHLKVVYSKEEALTPTGWEAEAAALGKRQIPGSSAFVPGTAGLILAGVVRDIAMAAPEA